MLNTHKPLVSVVVPTKNSSEFLGACLESVNKQTYKNIELIVVDNNSSDNTKKIAKKYTKKVFNKGPERSAQRNFGVGKSESEYVLIIDSDMELTEKVVEACVKKVQENKEMKALVIPEESFGEGFWAKCKALERSFYVGVDWMEAARFFEKSTYETLGGYDELITGTEDYDLPQRLLEQKGSNSIGRISEFIKHNEQNLKLLKTLKKKFYYAGGISLYISKKENIKYFKKQSNPVERYKLFLSKPQILFRKPMTGLGMFFMKSCEYVAGFAGYITCKLRSTNEN